MEQDLATDLTVLQSHLDGMIDLVMKTNTASRKYRDFEMRLLSLSSLVDIINHILDDTKTFFGFEQISISLVDETGEIEKLLRDDGLDVASRTGLILLKNKEILQTLFGVAILPYFDLYKSQRVSEFFVDEGRKPSSVAVAPLYRRGKYIGSFNIGSLKADTFDPANIKECVVHLGSVLSVCLENSFNFETIKRTSFIDTLTGVNNRRFFEQRFVEELDRCQRNADPISLLFLDIDFFKSINDKYGHPVGDQVLSLVAKAIKTQLRNNDVLARYGGEEFVALLSGIDANTAFDIAERIRKTVAALEIPHQELLIPITVSIGLATHHSDKASFSRAADTSTLLIQSADAALYQAKHNGRNRVERDVSGFFGNGCKN